MAKRLILHIGTQKSGSTYLQKILAKLSPDLPPEKVVYPIGLGANPRQFNHEYATYPVLREDIPYISESQANQNERSWLDLKTAVAATSQVALLSGEAISLATEAGARRLITELGVEDVTVIVTSRNLGAVIPSSYQQLVRNGRSRYLDQVVQAWVDDRGPGDLSEQEAYWESDPEHSRWRAYAAGSLVARWERVVGAGKVVTVTVPAHRQAPETLWHRFVEACGLQDALPADPPTLGDRAANVGITEPEAMAFVDAMQVPPALEWTPRQRKWMLDRSVRDCLGKRTDDRGRKPKIMASQRPLLEPIVAADLGRLRGLGAPIVGDIAELELEDSSFADEPVPADQVMAAYRHLLPFFVDLARRNHEEAEELRNQPPQPEPPPPPPPKPTSLFRGRR